MASIDLKLSDKIIIATGIVLSLSSLVIWNSPNLMAYFLDAKLHQKSQPIGQINKALNDTRRRYGGSLSWYPLGKNQTLYENDTLFSGEDSSAEIQIQSGDNHLSLTMTSNTMLSLSAANGDSLLNLELGSIASILKKGQKLKLKIGGTETTLQAAQDSKLRVVSTTKGQALLSSQSGQIDVISGTEKKNLTPETLINIQDNKITTQEVEFKYMQPRDGQPIILSEKEKIPFLWQNKFQRARTLSLQVSQDSSFSSIVAESDAGSEILAEELTKSGSYYWRLLDKKNMQSSNIQFFEIIKKEDLRHLFPQDEHFEKTNQDQLNLEFKWTTPAWSQSFQLEIATDSDFKNVLHSKSINDNKITITLPRGRYFWRLQTEVAKNNQKVITTPTEFAIGVQNSFQEFLDSLTPPTPTQSTPAATPKKLPSSHKYANAKLTFQPIEAWVEKISPDDSEPPRQIKININKSREDSDVLIEVADNRSFEKSEKKITKNKTETFNLNETGTYYVKANYVNDKKQIIESPQAQMQFPYRVEYFVETPKLIQPDNNLKMVSFGEAQLSLYFEWRKNKHSDKYVFQLSANADFSRVLTEKITTDNSHYLNENFLQEKLFWRVKALYKNSESNWSSPRVIHLK